MATRLLQLIALLIAILAAPLPAIAQDATTPAATDFAGMTDALGQGGFPDREKAMNALVATPDERVPPILQALADGDLYVRESDGKVVIALKSGKDFALTDPVDGADLGAVPSGDIEKIKVN